MAKILVVEDNTVLNEAYRILFEHNGYKVATCFNGQEALDTLLKFKPSVIVLDLLMPVMDGIEFLKSFRTIQSYKKIKVVLLTNLGDDQEVKKAIELGADAYALKADMGPTELLDFVKQYI